MDVSNYGPSMFGSQTIARGLVDVNVPFRGSQVRHTAARW